MASTRRRTTLSVVGFLTAAVVVAGCAGGNVVTPPPHSPRADAPADRAAARQIAGLGEIQHVVIIVQENRSFDYLFHGYPGADTVDYGATSAGVEVPLEPLSLAAHYDISHGSGSFFEAYDGGRLDGFDRESTRGPGAGAFPNPQYGFAPPQEVVPYTEMAQQYVLADRMFTSQLDGSFTAHQYLIAAYAGHSVNFPHGAWGCGPPPGQVQTLSLNRTIGPREPACFAYASLADELDAAGVTWRYYAPGPGETGALWLGYDAIRNIKFGPDWNQDVVSPESRVVADIGNGMLAGVTWIVPRLTNSDHGGSRSTNGPLWVASLVNAVGQSKFWNTTAIFVIWDDWGGWYDHVPPPQLDYDGLGFRVPMLCISPYAQRGFVSHVQYESSSIVRYVEETFGLPTMSAADARATSAGVGCLVPGQVPRPFVPINPQLPDSLLRGDVASDLGPDDE